MQAKIGAAMYHLNDGLSSFSERNTTELSYHQFGDLYQQIGIAESGAGVLSSSSLLTAEERKTLSYLVTVLWNLESLLHQVSVYQERAEPFQLSVCEKVSFETEQDIIDEIESFRESLHYTDSTMNEERWDDLLANFDGNGKRYCDTWESPLLQ